MILLFSPGEYDIVIKQIPGGKRNENEKDGSVNSGSSIRIITDGSAGICRIVQEFCPQVQVTACVSNGMKLVECMEAQHPDIVILDINMPVLDGLGALEIIRLKKIRAKFIVVTAYSKFEFAKKAVSLGAEEYILKSVNEKTLVDTLGRVCAQLDAEKKSRQGRGTSDVAETVLPLLWQALPGKAGSVSVSAGAGGRRIPCLDPGIIRMYERCGGRNCTGDAQPAR